MVIIEGPDGSGKTTLAHALCGKLDVEYRRPPEELLSSTHGPSSGLVEWWREQMRRPDRDGVYDRTFWISEPIYASVSNRPPLCTPQEMWRGIHDLWAENPYLVFCMTSEEAMIENVYSGGRPRLALLEQGEREKLRSINFLYHSFYAWAKAALFENCRLYDYSVSKPQHIVEWINE